MSAMSIENGKRIAFDHPSAAGIGGLVTINGATSFAYPAARNTAGPRPGDKIELDGNRYMVTTVAELRAPRMLKLGLEPLN